MNLNQLINMAIRIVTRRLINAGITKGIDFATRKKGSGAAGADVDPRVAKDAAETTKRARRAAKLGRRMGRF